MARLTRPWSSFRRIRVAVLLLVLVAVAGWALGVHRRRARRHEWRRPLHVSVLLLSHSELDADEAVRWRAGLDQLEKWFARESARWRTADAPIELTLFGPLRVARAPSFVPASEGWLDRARHAWDLSHALSALDADAGLREARFDVRLYVELEPGSADAARFAEGVGAQNGDFGLVRANTGDDLSLGLAAIAHELFHCLGASDKYDAAGHALVPAGLVAPEQTPRFPQPAAEVMVGEVPLSAAAGRVPDSLDEQRVGAETAREIGWRRAQ